MNDTPDPLIKIRHYNCMNNCWKFVLQCSFVCGACPVMRCGHSNDVLQASDEDRLIGETYCPILASLFKPMDIFSRWNKFQDQKP